MGQGTRKAMSSMLTQKAREEHIPLSGVFELTPRCTLNCKMCYVHLTPEQMGVRRELTAEEWIKIIDEASRMGLLYAQVTGGECLLHPGFREIFLKLKANGVLVAVNTNATLLDQYMEFFKENPPAKLLISLYGSTEDGYEQVTGYRVHEKVERSILKAKRIGLNVHLNISVSKYLYNETVDVVRFAVENKIPYTLDMNMQEPNEDTHRRLEDFGLSTEEIVEKYIQIGYLLGVDRVQNAEKHGVPKLENEKLSVKGMRCSAGRSKFMIHWDGRFSPCFWLNGDDTNVLDIGFACAWERIKVEEENYLRPVECESCEYLKVCSPCPYIRQDPKNVGHRNSKMCEVTIAKYVQGITKIK